MATKIQLSTADLTAAAARLGVDILGHTTFGWQQRSVGARVKTASDELAWLRVHCRTTGYPADKLWTGVEDSRLIEGVRRPDVLRVVDWQEKDVLWRAELLSLVTSAVCSPSPELRHALDLSDAWWRELRISLERLAVHSTDRVNTRQDLLRRRLTEQFGEGIDWEVKSWTSVHGDLHWANLTQPHLWILDWEAWGLGPRGLDAAFLRCFSLLVPPVEHLVIQNFGDWLATPDGVRSQLFACAELIRMTSLYGDHPDLSHEAEQLARRLLASGSRLR